MPTSWSSVCRTGKKNVWSVSDDEKSLQFCQKQMHKTLQFPDIHISPGKKSWVMKLKIEM
jgi:hypothetical protein